MTTRPILAMLSLLHLAFPKRGARYGGQCAGTLSLLVVEVVEVVEVAGGEIVKGPSAVHEQLSHWSGLENDERGCAQLPRTPHFEMLLDPFHEMGKTTSTFPYIQFIEIYHE